jgi:hypothetical protein
MLACSRSGRGHGGSGRCSTSLNVAWWGRCRWLALTLPAGPPRPRPLLPPRCASSVRRANRRPHLQRAPPMSDRSRVPRSRSGRETPLVLRLEADGVVRQPDHDAPADSRLGQDTGEAIPSTSRLNRGLFRIGSRGARGDAAHSGGGGRYPVGLPVFVASLGLPAFDPPVSRSCLGSWLGAPVRRS